MSLQAMTVQGTLKPDVPLVPFIMFDRVGQRAGQDLSQPGGQDFRLALAETVEGRVGAQQSLLDHVGSIQFAAEPAVEVQLRQDLQIPAIRFESVGSRLIH